MEEVVVVGVVLPLLADVAAGVVLPELLLLGVGGKIIVILYLCLLALNVSKALSLKKK
jgi:hypothetical protein